MTWRGALSGAALGAAALGIGGVAVAGGAIAWVNVLVGDVGRGLALFAFALLALFGAASLGYRAIGAFAEDP